jgi:hypothetical protein
MTDRLSVREARRTISKILAEGKTVSIDPTYRSLRGFIVGVPAHDAWNAKEKRKALQTAKKAFRAAIAAEL